MITHNLACVLTIGFTYFFLTSCTKSEDSPNTPQDTIPTASKTWQVSTFAGSGFTGTKDGTIVEARFSEPSKIAFDANGNLFVLDYSNRLIRKIANGVVSTFAGQDVTTADPSMTNIYDICIDSKNNLYTLEYDFVRKLIAPNDWAVFVGDVLSPGMIADGRGTEARFNMPRRMAVDMNGNLYVTDIGVPTKFLVRKITQEGLVTTIQLKDDKGDPFVGEMNAVFWSPITADNSGNIYFTESLHNTIKKADATGKVTLFAGSENANDPNSIFSYITSLVTDAEGNMYASDAERNAVFKITAKGTVSKIAGSGSAGHDDGPGDQAKFNYPTGLAIDSKGAIYVADQGNSLIRKIEYK